jgi:hypothetical protein
MGKMAELAAELEQMEHPSQLDELSEPARRLAERFAEKQGWAVGSYAEKLKEAFKAGYEAGASAHND